MKKRVALKVSYTRFTCGCPVTGVRPARWPTFVRAMKRLGEFQFVDGTAGGRIASPRRP